MSQFTQSDYIDTVFSELDIENLILDNISFENVIFKQCVFKEAQFVNCRFNECTFEHCDLSLSKWKGSSLSDVSFNYVNLTGVNWTEVAWPLVKLKSPLYFESSNVSYGSFFGLSLPDLFLERCKAHECDFREADLNQASFAESDLGRSLFMQTQLAHANFTDAINYHIDTRDNNIKGASFSFPEVINLLACQDIKIVGYDDANE